MFFDLVTRPLFNLLIFFYNIFGDLGLAIILFTVLLKLALNPLNKKQQKFQEAQQKISPKLKEIQHKHKDDRMALQKAQMELMKEHNFNPASGCLPIIVQMIVFITFYWILNPGNVFLINNGSLSIKQEALYSFISHPETLNKYFLHLVDLTKPNTILAILTAIAQFFQSSLMTKAAEQKKQEKNKQEKNKNLANPPEPDMAEMMNKQMKMMNYVFPVMIFYIGLSMPSGLPLYWFVSSIISIVQFKQNQQKPLHAKQ